MGPRGETSSEGQQAFVGRRRETGGGPSARFLRVREGFRGSRGGKVRIEIGWLKRGFSILRIFTDFRMPRLPMERHNGAGQRELSHCQREAIWRRSRPSSLRTASRLEQPG